MGGPAFRHADRSSKTGSLAWPSVHVSGLALAAFERVAGLDRYQIWSATRSISSGIATPSDCSIPARSSARCGAG